MCILALVAVFLVLALLAAVAIQEFRQEIPSPSAHGVCNSMHGLQCWGDDLKNIGPASTYDECCEACRLLPGCNAWTWNWQYGRECYLKSACSDKRSSSSYYSGIALPPPSPPAPSPPPSPSAKGICNSIHGLQCWGDDLQNIGSVITHEECCRACEALPGCKAWTWNWQYGRNCYLKSACSDKRKGFAYHSGIAIPEASWVPCAGGPCCNPYTVLPQVCPNGIRCQECGGGDACQCPSGPSPQPFPSPPTPSPGNTPFTALGCHSVAPLDDSSIWRASSGRWSSCDQDVRSDGMKKCIREDGQADETSIFLDMSSLPSSGGCFVSEASGCGTDMARVSMIEFDFDFSQCHDVWAAPLWITPERWMEPGGTSGEIDFLEMCPVGSVATNFGAPGQPGESQMKWGSGAGPNGPKHFTLILDAQGNLKTRICNLDGHTSCLVGAHYDGFIDRITSKESHHFVSDVWNGYGGDGGWQACGARHNAMTHCHYAIMNLRVHSNDGRPLYQGRCAALNGGAAVDSSDLVNGTFFV